MKKKNLKSTLAVAIVAVSATMGYVSYNQYQNQQLTFANPLMEENIEALSQDDNSNGYVWVEQKETQDCEYKFQLDGEGKVKVSFGGKETITLKGDAKAVITYTMPSAQITCKGMERKNVMCKPSECPKEVILQN